MRFMLPLLAACLFAISANAQTTATHPTHKHLTMDQRFQQANTTHDGHLTEEQANEGYKTIAHHFAAIDHDKRGYITEADIRAYYKTQRMLHHQATPPTHPQPNS
jgi:hypothetical protein